MRAFQAVALLCALVAGAWADDRRGPRRGFDQSELDIFVPIDPWEHERLYWKRKNDRDLVPGGVSINGEPRYVCDVDDEKFTDREKFVAHLRLVHGVPREDISGNLVNDDGVIHFAGE